jgi:hypothetical protein
LRIDRANRQTVTVSNTDVAGNRDNAFMRPPAAVDPWRV